jgi:hypothetical protein
MGGQTGVTALYVAAQRGYADVVKRLMANPKTDVNLGRKGGAGATPLIIASQVQMEINNIIRFGDNIIYLKGENHIPKCANSTVYPKQIEINDTQCADITLPQA